MTREFAVMSEPKINKQDIENALEKMQETFKKEETRIKTVIETELDPFITKIYEMGAESERFRLFKEAYQYFNSKYQNKRHLFASILDAASEISVEKIKDQLHLLFVYLGTIESIANTVVDMLVMLLVVNGRDLHIECKGFRTPRIRHVVSIKEDLEKERIALGMKISFLRENGIKEFTSIIDTKLRNRIAHLDFEIKDDNVLIKGKPAVIDAIFGLKKLLVAISTTTGMLYDAATERGIIPKEK